jgi:acetamidase/formamidase
MRVPLSTGLWHLANIAADLHVTQIVNIHKGAHMMLPKPALGQPKA